MTSATPRAIAWKAGFEERTIGDVQMLLSKPAARPEAIVPALEPRSSRAPAHVIKA